MTAFEDGLWARLVDEHEADRMVLGPVRAQGHRRSLVVGVSGMAVAGVAGVLAAVLLLTGGASEAFAGWTSQPTPPTAAQLRTATAYCAANVPMPGLPLQVTDARGPFVIQVYATGGKSDFCTVGPSFRNASGWTSSPPVTPPAEKLFLWTDHTAMSDGQPYGTMIAQAGDDVSAAKLTLDDGSVVTATVENGWVVAWWPGPQHLASAQLTTPSGPQTQTFARYPCDVYSCNGGGPHGGAPGGGPGGG